jgi:hypothetical protein
MIRPQPNCPQCDGQGYVIVGVLTHRHGIQSTEASCPTCCAPPDAYVRAWRDTYRWQSVQRACRHCGEWTHLRDEDFEPAHWGCAAMAARLADLGEVAR